MEFSFLLILLLVILAVAVVFLVVGHKATTATSGGKFGSPGRSYSSSSSSSRGVGSSKNNDNFLATLLSTPMTLPPKLSLEKYDPNKPTEYWEHMTMQAFKALKKGDDMLPYFQDWGVHSNEKNPYDLSRMVPNKDIKYLQKDGKDFIVMPHVINVYISYMKSYDADMTRLFVESYLRKLLSLGVDNIVDQTKTLLYFGTNLIGTMITVDTTGKNPIKDRVIINNVKDIYFKLKNINYQQNLQKIADLTKEFEKYSPYLQITNQVENYISKL